MKGDIESVAPALAEALQMAFGEKRNAFTVLERRHLDQVVKANQLERDLYAISHGGRPSEHQVKADGFLRSELVDGPDGAVLTVTLVSLDSVVIWQGQARESRAAWLVHETQIRNAEKLASEAESHIIPGTSQAEAGNQHSQSSPSQTMPHSAVTGQTMPGSFVTGSYSLTAGAARKNGQHLYVSLTLESLLDKPFRFVTLSVSCYLLDEDGN